MTVYLRGLWQIQNSGTGCWGVGVGCDLLNRITGLLGSRNGRGNRPKMAYAETSQRENCLSTYTEVGNIRQFRGAGPAYSVEKLQMTPIFSMQMAKPPRSQTTLGSRSCAAVDQNSGVPSIDDTVFRKDARTSVETAQTSAAAWEVSQNPVFKLIAMVNPSTSLSTK